MDEQMAALAKEVYDLRDRQLQDRHESILRDDAIFRRLSIHDERMNFHAEMLQRMVAAVSECAETVTRLGHRLDGYGEKLDGLSEKIDGLIIRMDKTDVRWNQLIEQLTREHQNGGAKQ